MNSVDGHVVRQQSNTGCCCSWLERNQLESLPPEITQLANLQELYLDNNRLKTLPPGIGDMPSLRKLCALIL